MRISIPTHFHRCPRCESMVPAYRDKATCADNFVRVCGFCLAKIFLLSRRMYETQQTEAAAEEARAEA